MALDSNGWLARDEHKSNVNQQNPIYLIPERRLSESGLLDNSSKSILSPTEHRFTQTEQNNYQNHCIRTGESRRSRMFDPNLQPSQQPPNQAVYAHVEKKECDPKPSSDFPFCYNMNALKVQQQDQQQSSNSNSNVPRDEKPCYTFDAAPPFYNYALVNQLAASVLKCEVCGISCSNASSLNQHKRIHNNISQTNERTFSCEACGIFFNNASELKSHKISTHKTTKCCTICGVERGCEHSKTPTKKSKFIRCENNVNSNAVGNFTSNQPPVVQSPISGQNGQVTKELHHPVKRRSMATVTKCNQCNGSGIVFLTMARHIEKPFQCNICDGRFSRYSSLWSHKRLHSGDKPFKCEACGLNFAKAAYLKNHLRVHTGEKPFKCDVCGMQFSQSPHLKNHERIHSGERPYQCEVCDKTFARHSTLWNHRRIHTGEKPYRCEICGSAFNQATHLKNHGKVHTGEKPHRCDICEVGFSDRFALKRHRNIHEKYARTVPNQQPPPSSQQQTTPPQPPQPLHQVQSQTQIEEQYKFDVSGVSGPIAFPGCSRPQDQK